MFANTDGFWKVDLIVMFLVLFRNHYLWGNDRTEVVHGHFCKDISIQIRDKALVWNIFQLYFDHVERNRIVWCVLIQKIECCPCRQELIAIRLLSDWFVLFQGQFTMNEQIKLPASGGLKVSSMLLELMSFTRIRNFQPFVMMWAKVLKLSYTRSAISSTGESKSHFSTISIRAWCSMWIMLKWWGFK